MFLLMALQAVRSTEFIPTEVAAWTLRCIQNVDAWSLSCEMPLQPLSFCEFLMALTTFVHINRVVAKLWTLYNS